VLKVLSVVLRPNKAGGYSRAMLAHIRVRQKASRLLIAVLKNRAIERANLPRYFVVTTASVVRNLNDQFPSVLVECQAAAVAEVRPCSVNICGGNRFYENEIHGGDGPGYIGLLHPQSNTL